MNGKVSTIATTNRTKWIPVSAIHEAAERLKSVVVRTPLVKNENLSHRYACHVYLKREDMQTVRSFKIRGAYNKIASLTPEVLQNGVICASAGNHAQGVAFACMQKKVTGVIYMPTTTPKQKISKVRHFGGEYVNIVLHGDTYDDAQQAALDAAAQSGAAFIHPFNDDTVIAGQGTLGLELDQEMDVHIDYVLLAVGGGGLIAGVGSYFKALSPDTKIIGVESEGAPAMTRSLEEGALVTLNKIDSFVDGIAVRKVGQLTFDIAREVVDQMVTVPEGKICSTMLNLYNDEAIVVEPAGAIGVAALDALSEEIKGKNVVIILCGGNNDISRTAEIRERSLLWEGKKHYFIIRFPQRAGALREFLHVLGPDDDIAHFEYSKKRNSDTGPALVGIELKRREDYNGLIRRMEEKNIQFLHINNDPMLFEMLI